MSESEASQLTFFLFEAIPLTKLETPAEIHPETSAVESLSCVFNFEHQLN